MNHEYPQGIKWTKQRKDVYNILHDAAEPLSAQQIYNQIAKADEDGSYAPSTIYRILGAFEEKGLVRKTTWMDDSTVVYELKRGGHTHYAVCLTCHKRVPLRSCPFAHIHFPETGDDFQITEHKLELYGYCKECKNAKK
ncbi:MAG: transcriptional repressor [Lachnospiraceae bacterium]|nr:transcriptional repressor [Lachnospiraceae bacterium]